MRTRTLRLARETLSVLDAGDLRSVVGATGALCVDTDATFRVDCLNDLSFEQCPTPTLPVEQCV